MFTGIIEETGRVLTSGSRITISCRGVLDDAVIGASIAVNGTCITAVELGEGHFSADLSPETLARTNLGLLTIGAAVNLERPLRFNGRLDGHFVLGHVDGTAEIVGIDLLGAGNWLLRVRMPENLLRYIVSKASVAIDGISLTVAAVAENLVDFAIIPHTWSHTNLQAARPGTVVNVEVDILAKHIEKLLAGR
ncbi:MAG TPA: riboflavin synthase [Bryobacteraceae bacterium]|jgi:riboflavin synthase|nr:riboflavin synthase [Bryobacteraceae bacterium]